MWVFLGRVRLMRLSVSTVISAVGGFVAAFLGGIDQLLVTLITFIALDYVTGVVKAVFEKKLSSAVGFRGILKKVLILLMVGLSVALERIMPAALPLREMTVLFFISNEGFSIVENTAGFIPLPEKLKAVLKQLQSDSADTKEAQNQKDPMDPNNKK